MSVHRLARSLLAGLIAGAGSLAASDLVTGWWRWGVCLGFGVVAALAVSFSFKD